MVKKKDLFKLDAFKASAGDGFTTAQDLRPYHQNHELQSVSSRPKCYGFIQTGYSSLILAVQDSITN